ncbi:MAG: pseudouridine synthase [Planctomycetota bacterium]
MPRKPTPGKPTHSYTDNTRGIRLQKAMANAGIASRRECETIIQDGRVTINGQRIHQLPAWADPFEDRIEVDGEPLIKPKTSTKKFASSGKVYIMVHKPRGVLSTNDDPEGRRRLIDLIDPSAIPRGVRLFPVGRLDADSTGLILMTNDGELTHRLTHPSFGVTKRYLVSAKGRLVEDDLKKLRKGLVLADRTPGNPSKTKKPGSAGNPAAPDRVVKNPGGGGGKKASMEAVQILRHETDRTRGDRTTLSITLTEGQNREIRRLLARVGIKVKKLKRTALGPVRLKGLAPSQWRMLNTQEVWALRRAVKIKGVKSSPSGDAKASGGGGGATYVSEKPKPGRGWSTPDAD